MLPGAVESGFWFCGLRVRQLENLFYVFLRLFA